MEWGTWIHISCKATQLRPFGGKLTKWTSFWDSFESAVHNNRELSDIGKFNYLTSLLKRSAREAISGVSLTTTNYHKAIETLQKRFRSKQQIINKYMDVLLYVEAVHFTQNTRALCSLFDNVSSHVHSLQSLAAEPNSYGCLLCPVLLTKLPAELQLTISRKVTEADWNLDSLMKAVKEEITTRKRIGVNNTNQAPPWREDKTPLIATTLVGNPDSGTSPVVIAVSCIIQPIAIVPLKLKLENNPSTRVKDIFHAWEEDISAEIAVQLIYVVHVVEVYTSICPKLAIDHQRHLLSCPHLNWRQHLLYQVLNRQLPQHLTPRHLSSHCHLLRLHFM